MYGIKKRLVGSYLIIIVITVLLFELCMLIAVQQYYIGHIRDTLQNKAEASASFYNQYLSEHSLQEQANHLVNSFAETTSAQVQIIGVTGIVLGDSTGMTYGKTITKPDVRAALDGTFGEWRGTMPDTGERVLSVSVPLQNTGNTIGVLRLTTSLVETYAIIQRITWLLAFTGITIITISIVISLFLSASITRPIKELIKGAEEMAAGKFTVRIPKQQDDELGKLIDTMHYMAAEITRHEQLKTAFIASISHELRTPLTSIKGWVITLLSDPEQRNPLVQEGLEIIDTETERLTLLVEDLLDFSRLAEGKTTLYVTSIQVAEWVQQVIKLLAPRAERQSVTFLVDVAPDLPIIAGDVNRLKQVLLNLVDNALKFTPSGGEITICAQAVEKQIQVSVKDNGTGIAEEKLPHIKKRFYQASESVPGNGLGLAICDEIMMLHGGKIEIHSRLGDGTQVDLFFPLTHPPRKEEQII
ncbi:sensor histidine kinase [Aneurinibacillus sp. REN35]|uniref:sensor histidine kinase n=1 Tax=Aneurinibacillus sp. REN35 TaxID=3237286 RepID=UPI003526E891